MKPSLRITILGAGLGIVALLLFGCAIGKSKNAVFYVSPSGNDSWSGTLSEPDKNGADGPFATFEKARDAIRILKTNGRYPKGGVTVFVRDGVYSFTDTFTLAAEDSGSAGAPVVWKASPGESVRLIGGKVVAGFGPVTDQLVLERIDPGCRENILVTDLKSQGITDYGEIHPRGPIGLELFFKGRPMTIARYPNEGWMTISAVPQSGDSLVFKGVLPHIRFGIPVGRHYGKFNYDGDRPSRWKNTRDLFLHGYWSWDWYDEFLKVKAIDIKKREIFIQEPHSGYGYTKGQRFYAMNILEELDSPEEWYLDRTSGLLYFWPPEQIGEGDVMASTMTDVIMSLKETSHVSIENIVFECSRGDAVNISGGTDNRIAGCTIRNIAGTAIQINGGTNNGAVSCDVYDVNSGIAVLGGDRATLTPAGNYAVNNNIHHYSRIIRTYGPAISIYGVGNRIANNCIHDAPHMAVSFSGNEHILEYNEVYRIAQETGDVGAFYIGRDWTQRGNIIRHNYFHHLEGPGLYGVMAVYLDDWTSGQTIYGNVFYNAGRSVFIGGGRDNLVENNIIVGGQPAVHVDARGLSWASYYFDHSLEYSETQLFDLMKKYKFNEPPYSEKYPELGNYLEDEPAVPKHNTIIHNVSYGGTWLSLIDGLDFSVVTVKENVVADSVLCVWQKKIGGPETTHLFGDPEVTAELEKRGNILTPSNPGITDIENENFTLKEDSPAFTVGFKPIPFDKIGLYIDAYRTKLPE